MGTHGVIAEGLPLWHGAQLAVDTRCTVARPGAGRPTAVEWHHMQLGSKRQPTQNSLAREEGLATGSSGATHPSRKGPSRLPSSWEFPLGLQSGESFSSLFVGRPVPSTGEDVPSWTLF